MSCLSKEDKDFFEGLINNTREQTRKETWAFVGDMLGINPSNVEDCQNLRDNYQWLNRTRKEMNEIGITPENIRDYKNFRNIYDWSSKSKKIADLLSITTITTTVSVCVGGCIYWLSDIMDYFKNIKIK